MSERANGHFSYRAFVSVLAGFTFVAMAGTGLVMFFAPSCRIARDTSWSVWGYDKTQWTAVHVWFSIAFVAASAFHIYLNWAALTNYFKARLHRGFAFRTEWIAALAICGVIGLGTIYEVSPFSSLVAWKQTIKYGQPGMAAGGRGRPFDGAPVQSPAASMTRYGMGQKTLRQFCADEGIELSWALSRLRDEGLTAMETMTMRQIADGAGVHPRELRAILQR
jgi:Domain of unknown function (DUF4405)